MCFFQLLIPGLTPVSLLENESGFEIVTQIADTEKDNLRISSPQYVVENKETVQPDILCGGCAFMRARYKYFVMTLWSIFMNAGKGQVAWRPLGPKVLVYYLGTYTTVDQHQKKKIAEQSCVTRQTEWCGSIRATVAFCNNSSQGSKQWTNKMTSIRLRIDVLVFFFLLSLPVFYINLLY